MSGDDRDFDAEIDTLLRAGATGSGFAAPVVATKILLQLEEKDPDLLDGWLHRHAGMFLTERLGGLVRSDRGVARRRAGAHAFNDAVESARAGDVDALSSFDVFSVVTDDGTRRQARHMTGPDFVYVAKQYETSARTDRMLGSFNRAVAKKIGPRRLSEAMDVETYDRMYREIVKPAA